MSSIGKTLAAACSLPADAVVAAAEVAGAAAAVAAAGSVAAVVAAVAGSVVAAAAGSVASGSVAAPAAWVAPAARVASAAARVARAAWVAGVAPDPGERAACAKSHEKHRCDGRRITIAVGTRVSSRPRTDPANHHTKLTHNAAAKLRNGYRAGRLSKPTHLPETGLSDAKALGPFLLGQRKTRRLGRVFATTGRIRPLL
jgi:hypothetical protein